MATTLADHITNKIETKIGDVAQAMIEPRRRSWNSSRKQAEHSRRYST